MAECVCPALLHTLCRLPECAYRFLVDRALQACAEQIDVQHMSLMKSSIDLSGQEPNLEGTQDGVCSHAHGAGTKALAIEAGPRDVVPIGPNCFTRLGSISSRICAHLRPSFPVLF
jgi:hypothetical protein